MDGLIYATPLLLWGVIAWAVMWWVGRRRWWVSILIVALAPVVTFYPAMIYGERVATCTGHDCGSLIFVAMLILRERWRWRRWSGRRSVLRWGCGGRALRAGQRGGRGPR